MKSIKKNVSNEIIIDKSKFITKLYKIKNKDDINNKLDYLKKEYKDSTHICYGYIFENDKKATDDGEPSGTAGNPILNVLEKNELNYILAVVIRYFGGIKLGANGLIRAYSSSISEALKLTNIVTLVDGLYIKLIIDYNNIKTMDNLLKNVNISYKEYNEDITYEIKIDKENSNLELLKKNSKSFEIIDNIKIEKNTL